MENDMAATADQSEKLTENGVELLKDSRDLSRDLSRDRLEEVYKENEGGREEEDYEDDHEVKEKEEAVMVEEEDYGGVPVDRGWGWVVCAACFGMHVLVVGGAKSFSVLFVEIQEKYDVNARDLNIAQGTTISLIIGLVFLANILSVIFTTRVVVFTGGLLTGTGFILTAFIPSFKYIYITYTVIVGVGLGLSYGPCVVMVGQHFRKYRSMANGIAVSGSGVGSFVLPNLFRFLLNTYGLQGSLLILGALMFNLCVFGLLNRPLSSYKKKKKIKLLNGSIVQPPHIVRIDTEANMTLENSVVPNLNYFSVSQTSLFQRGHHYIKHREIGASHHDLRRPKLGSCDVIMASLQNIPQHQMEEVVTDCCSRMTYCLCCWKSRDEQRSRTEHQKVFDWSLLTNSIFLLYMFSCMMGHFAYPNVFLIMPAHTEMIGFSKDTSALFLSVMGITDLVGRLFFGWFADRKIIPGRYGFLGCMAISGVLNLIVPFLTTFAGIIVYVCLYGFFAGCYIALIAALLADTLGTEKLGSSFGLVMLAMALSTFTGPPLCGFMRDVSGSWTGAFIFCGIAAIVGAMFPLFVPCAERREERRAKITQQA